MFPQFNHTLSLMLFFLKSCFCLVLFSSLNFLQAQFYIADSTVISIHEATIVLKEHSIETTTQKNQNSGTELQSTNNHLYVSGNATIIGISNLSQETQIVSIEAPKKIKKQGNSPKEEQRLTKKNQLVEKKKPILVFNTASPSQKLSFSLYRKSNAISGYSFQVLECPSVKALIIPTTYPKRIIDFYENSHILSVEFGRQYIARPPTMV